MRETTKAVESPSSQLNIRLLSSPDIRTGYERAREVRIALTVGGGWLAKFTLTHSREARKESTRLSLHFVLRALRDQKFRSCAADFP